MKNKIIQLIVFLNVIFFVTQNLFADTLYVSKTGGHVSPFSSLGNAATNIQAAVDAASAGDTVLVNDGTYYPDRQISITKNIIVKSINGAENTIVDGGYPTQTNRCFYLNNANPTIDGFTITNANMNNNSGSDWGGGILCYIGGIVQNCNISGNSAGLYGGGVFCHSGGTVQNCTISGNLAGNNGGGVRCYGGTIQNCTISKNSTRHSGGGVHCSLGTVQNCTISENSAHYSGGGVYCADSTVQNSILWGNNKADYFSSSSINQYNCIENWTTLDNVIITNNPKFISDNDFRLQGTSLCRNSGTNLPYVFETFDLEGNSRIMGYTVDLGAYEYVEAIQYPPAPAPVIDYSEIDYGKISWTLLNEIPRAEDYVLQEQFGGTNGSWSTIYTGTNSNLLIQRLNSAYYRVAAHNNFGESDWSASILSTPTAIVINTSQINVGKISWTPVLANISQATKFVVEEQIGGIWAVVYDGTSANTTVQRITNGSYRVRAENTTLQSDWSASILSTPSAIVINTSEINEGKISWTPILTNISKATKFIVEEQIGGIWSVVYDGTSANTTIQRLKSANYRVRAENATLQSDWSASILSTPPAIIINTSQINQGIISWTPTLANISKATKFVIEEQIGATWSVIYDGTSSSTTIQKITNASYRVRSENTTFQSDWSASILSTPPAIVINTSEINEGKISWTPTLANISQATKFVVEEQIGGIWSVVYDGISANTTIQRLKSANYRVRAENATLRSDWSASILSTPPAIVINILEINQGTISWTPTLANISQATKFVVEEQIGGTWAVVYDGTTANITIQRITNASYRVRSENTTLQSDWSSSVLSTPPIIVINSSQINQGIISWTPTLANISQATKFVVEEQIGGIWSVVYDGTSANTTVQRLKSANYRVRAENATLQSDWSASILSTPPAIIINTSQINQGIISWTPILANISKATKFVVERNASGNWQSFYEGSSANTTVERINSAYYRVVAASSTLQSDWSASVFYSNYPINVTSLNASQLSDGSGYVSIDVWVSDQNLDLSDLKIEYSLNNGASWANGDPFMVSIAQSGQSPSINNSSEYQANNILPDYSIITILWDTVSAQNGGGSLANQRFEQSKVRLTPRNAYSQGYFMFSSPFVIDNLAVTNASVMINNNEAETSTPSVSLQLHAEGTPPLYMRISNGLNFGNSPWQNYTTWKNWILSPASGTKIVYVQFKNDKGYISSVQDSILLDNWDFSNFEGAINVTYLMGRSGSVADEVPAHFVNLTTTAMYKTEISNFEFAQFLSEGGYSDNSYWSSAGWSWKTANSIVCPLYWETTDTPNYANDPYANSDSEPVVGISYYEAEAYANWSDYELPTESQWEYFAKDGDERHYPWADDFWYTSTQPSFNLCNWKLGLNGYTEMGFTSDGSEFTRYVTSYSEGKGHCGHYNLSGNVAEWVKDWYGTYGAATVTDPEGSANGTERVVRGGSFVHERDDLTTTRRMHYSPEFRTNWLGMRVAKNDVVPEGGFLIFNFIFLIYCLKRIK